jgi:hypothetical protein
MTKKRSTPDLPLLSFIFCSFILVFSLGVAVGHFRLLPAPLMNKAKAGYEELQKLRLRSGSLRRQKNLPWYYKRLEHPGSSVKARTPGSSDGVNLVTRVADRLELGAELIDMNGRLLHRWAVDWFELWPHPDHLPSYAVPKSRPGTHLHGAVLLENGNLVVNFEHLGTVCLDPDSSILWKLPYRTHHSIHLHDEGTLWICGQITHHEAHPDFPDRKPPFDEYTILEVSPAGTILKEWSVDRILRDNGHGGLLASSPQVIHPLVQDDILHLNDAEPFPASMPPGIFCPGDVIVSLRNIHTVFVFNRDSGAIKYISRPGMFTHQHDPDFIDGDSYSVFDNNVPSIDAWPAGTQSRIVKVSPRDNSSIVCFEGRPGQPFFTPIMGKHQWLENGHLLITESMSGRAFEIDGDGNLVWEWINFVDKGIIGIVEQVHRLPAGFELRLNSHAAKRE